jgi:DNA-binding NarL/FixJ family response regulator
VRILIAEDHQLVREGLRLLLSQTNEIVGEASSAGEAVKAAEELKPDLVLMDISMAGMPAILAAKEIAKQGVRVLFCSAYGDEATVHEAMQAGHGYVLKDSPATELARAVAEVGRGGAYVSSGLLPAMIGRYRARHRNEDERPALSKREQEVLKLLAESNTVKDIAEKLNLSVRTVDSHKYSVMKKTGFHSIAALVRYAIEQRIIRVSI